MVTAFVLVGYEASRGTEVLRGIRAITGVKKATDVLGRWDIVVRVEAKDLKELSEIALQINGSKGVSHSESLITLE